MFAQLKLGFYPLQMKKLLGGPSAHGSCLKISMGVYDKWEGK